VSTDVGSIYRLVCSTNEHVIRVLAFSFPYSHVSHFQPAPPALELVRSGMRLDVVWQLHVSVCRLLSWLWSLNFDYVSRVLRLWLVANVNSSVSSCVEHWKSNDKVLQWFRIVFARIQHSITHCIFIEPGLVGSRVRRRWVALDAVQTTPWAIKNETLLFFR